MLKDKIMPIQKIIEREAVLKQPLQQTLMAFTKSSRTKKRNCIQFLCEIDKCKKEVITRPQMMFAWHN